MSPSFEPDDTAAGRAAADVESTRAAQSTKRIDAQAFIGVAAARYEKVLTSLGFNPKWVFIPGDHPNAGAWKEARNRYDGELGQLRGLLPPGIPTPSGWEGDPPDREIASLCDLAAWLACQLDTVRSLTIGQRPDPLGRVGLEMGRDAVCNAFRVLDQLGVVDRPRWPDRLDDPFAVERALSELLVWARKRSQTDGADDESNASLPAAIDRSRAVASQTGSTRDADEMPVLSQRGYLVLQALFQMEAFSADARQRTDDIAKKCEGTAANPAQFKESIVDLKRRGLLRTKEGRGGGCWLTERGRAKAEKL